MNALSVTLRGFFFSSGVDICGCMYARLAFTIFRQGIPFVFFLYYSKLNNSNYSLFTTFNKSLA
jgi:hypothetical protein